MFENYDIHIFLFIFDMGYLQFWINWAATHPLKLE